MDWVHGQVEGAGVGGRNSSLVVGGEEVSSTAIQGHWEGLFAGPPGQLLPLSHRTRLKQKQQLSFLRLFGK